jgi:PhnB protein
MKREEAAMKIHELYVYLTVRGAGAAIEYYTKAFGAKEKFRLTEPGGRIGHAEMDFGGWTLMLADEFPEYGLNSATTIGATPVTIHLHVDSADEVIRRAAGAGGTVEMEPKDEFYGERSGVIRDPFGHRWLIGHHIEDVTPEEMQRRYDRMMAG